MKGPKAPRNHPLLHCLFLIVTCVSMDVLCDSEGMAKINLLSEIKELALSPGWHHSVVRALPHTPKGQGHIAGL